MGHPQSRRTRGSTEWSFSTCQVRLLAVFRECPSRRGILTTLDDFGARDAYFHATARLPAADLSRARRRDPAALGHGRPRARNYRASTRASSYKAGSAYLTRPATSDSGVRAGRLLIQPMSWP